MIIYAADDPLVLNGTYDREGYKPGERERIAKARARAAQQEETPMAKTRKAKPAGTSKNRHRTPAKRAKAATPARPARPRTPSLPGMEDSAIQSLEDAAAAYADIRDQRMALNAEEVGLKAKLLRLMKSHGKTTYHRDGITIEIVVEEEKVKVRIKKPGDDDGEEDSEVEAAGDGTEEQAEA